MVLAQVTPADDVTAFLSPIRYAIKWLGLVAAMVAASATTVLLILIRRRRGRAVGVLLPISLAYVVVKAIAGVLTESQVVYFGAGLALSATIALAVGATAFTRMPIASYVIPYVTPYRVLGPNHHVSQGVGPGHADLGPG